MVWIGATLRPGFRGFRGFKRGIRVLKIDGPSAQGFLSLTAPTGLRVVVAPFGRRFEKNIFKTPCNFRIYLL